MVVTTADKLQSRSSLPRPRLSSVYRQTRRSLAASSELCDAVIVSFTGLMFYRVFDRGYGRSDCYSAGFELTKLMTKGDSHWGRILIFRGGGDFP